MTSEYSHEPDALGVVLDSAREAADAGTLSGAQAVQLFRAVCLLRVDGPLVGKERNLFADSTRLFSNWARTELHDPSPESWSAVLDIRLDGLMHDVLMSEHFLEEDLTIIAVFFETLERIIAHLHRLSHHPNGERELAAVHRVSLRANDACEVLWAHRQSLSALWTPGIRDDVYSPRGAYILPLVCAYIHCAVRAPSIPLKFVVLKLFLLLWVSCREQWHPSTMDLAFELHGRVFYASDDKTNEDYIKEAIIDTFGPDLFFERVLQDIQLEGLSGRYRAALLQSLCLPGLHPLMLSSFKKYRGLDVAAAILDKYGTDPDDETRAMVCGSASYLVHKCVAEYFLQQDLLHPILIVDGALLVGTLTRGIRLVADDCPKLEQEGKENLCELIQSYTEMLEARERRPHARTFMAQIKTNARIEWWPNLARLQAAHYRAREDQLLRLILRGWGGFGTACGLDEEKERKRHRREGRAFCSWPVCEYSATKPPGKLLLCQACGEAQYCGRECQKKDWSEGGHKKRCGNRLRA